MELMSNDFGNNEDMPKELTCDGKDVSPHLAWSEPPEGTKGFAISCIDPDAPMGDWVHWLVCNIPGNVTELEKGQDPPGTEIRNDFGKPSYGGPCPPSGKHRYVFAVYALDTDKLDTSGMIKDSFVHRVKEHTIGSAQLIGLYERS
jgi:Raf kinase inhibitor-like YbhB/YbcL family protein